MAERKAQRQKQVQPRAKAAVRAVASADPRGPDGWRRECERLRAELQVARDEIAALRSREEQALNRIDWVLDSLNGALQRLD